MNTIPSRNVTAIHDPVADRLPSQFHWQDPATLPPRPWLYGQHLLRGHVSVTVAPGGVGKSSLLVSEALAMASGRELLGDWVAEILRVWILNLEDPHDELQRRITAAMLYHGIEAHEINGQLYADSGRNRPLCIADQTRDGVAIRRAEMDGLAREIMAHRIDVLIIDPFISSHQVNENDNVAIDLVAKEWARLAEQCNCAIELVHHTRKINGEAATTESARGASALLGAARSGRVLNKMSEAQMGKAGVQADLATYFAVSRDKANLAPAGKRQWRRIVSVELPNGDSVGVAETWDWPDADSGVTVKNLVDVQEAIDGKFPRYSPQSTDNWVGNTVAHILGLNPIGDRKRIKKIIEEWLKSGALKKVKHTDKNRNSRPCVAVGEWATE